MASLQLPSGRARRQESEHRLQPRRRGPFDRGPLSLSTVAKAAERFRARSVSSRSTETFRSFRTFKHTYNWTSEPSWVECKVTAKLASMVEVMD